MVKLFLLFLIIPLCLSSELFSRGRPKNKYGMLGKIDVEETHFLGLPQGKWFTQKLDHFNAADQRTWQQRYFVNASMYVPGGPVFLQIGGEGEASATWVVKGSMVDYAQKYGALCLLLEHRYYGKSHPTPDMSVENLVYLSSEQALADLAHFITSMTKSFNLPSGTQWVSFGGSYPGSLSAWLRYKYPHLVSAAVASSAPILAKLDFYEYYQVVRDSLMAEGGSECPLKVQQGIQEMESLLKTKNGHKILRKIFDLCDNWNQSNKLDVANLFNTMMDNFAGIVQYNRDNRNSDTKNITVSYLCHIMKKANNPLIGLSMINDLMRSPLAGCLNATYQSEIEEMLGTDWASSAAAGGRQWFYQTCVEFGFYQTSTANDQPFGHHVSPDFYLQQCIDTFGEAFNVSVVQNGIDRTNTNYGGYGMKPTRVVFPNGSIDPWHALGVTKDLSPNATAIYIQGTAHCANMYPASPQDPPQLIEARHEIDHLLGEWLSNPL